VVLANRYGYRVTGVHTFGDKAYLMMLDAYQKAGQESSLQGKLFALDHGMMVSPEVIRQSAQQGVIWSLQPPLFYGRYAMGVNRIYGEEYAHTWMLPVKSLIDAGVKVSYGADTHNDPERHPLFNLETLVTRKTFDGRVFGPREAIDRSTGLLMMTRWGAEYVLAEKKLGSIEPGKLADLVILEKNPLDTTIPDEDLSEIKVIATLIGGEVVYGSLSTEP
jgi:predicted amidohydrolase YtcJ